MCYGEYRGRREIKPFIRYVEARLDEKSREETYRIYVTKSLQLLPQNKYLTASYEDAINPSKSVDNRTGDEIVADIISRAGLRFEV